MLMFELRKEQELKEPVLTGQAVHFLVLIRFMVDQSPRQTVLVTEGTCLFHCVEHTLPDISSFASHNELFSFLSALNKETC